MAELWTTNELPGLCDPTWTTDPQPTDEPPNPWAIRQAELNDLTGQRTSLRRLYCAHTLPTRSYL